MSDTQPHSAGANMAGLGGKDNSHSFQLLPVIIFIIRLQPHTDVWFTLWGKKKSVKENHRCALCPKIDLITHLLHFLKMGV